MKMICCAIRDNKAEAWMTPMFFQAAGQAIRSFGDAVNDTNTDFGKHPEDYSIWHIGNWDSRSAIFDAEQQPTVLQQGINLVQGTA